MTRLAILNAVPLGPRARRPLAMPSPATGGGYYEPAGGSSSGGSTGSSSGISGVVGGAGSAPNPVVGRPPAGGAAGRGADTGSNGAALSPPSSNATGNPGRSMYGYRQADGSIRWADGTVTNGNSGPARTSAPNNGSPANRSDLATYKSQLQQQQQELQRRKSECEKEAERIDGNKQYYQQMKDNAQNQLQQDLQGQANEQRTARAAADRQWSLSKFRCPDGNGWNDCIKHPRAKQEYLNDRQQALAEAERLGTSFDQAVNQDRSALRRDDEALTQLQREQEQLRQKCEQLRDLAGRHNAGDLWLFPGSKPPIDVYGNGGSTQAKLAVQPLVPPAWCRSVPSRGPDDGAARFKTDRAGQRAEPPPPNSRGPVRSSAGWLGLRSSMRVSPRPAPHAPAASHLEWRRRELHPPFRFRKVFRHMPLASRIGANGQVKSKACA